MPLPQIRIHTAETLQAACAEIARSIGPYVAVTITVGYSLGVPTLYVALYEMSRSSRSEVITVATFEDALAKAREVAAGWRIERDAAEREYASWLQPVAAE